MFAVIFEVQPKPERFDDYLALARELKPKLEAIDGFVDNERFKSLRDGRRLVSLSTWRDEKAVIRWRTQGEHHGVQEKGRSEVFEDYHLRVGEITADSHMPPGETLEQQRLDPTEVGVAKLVSLCEGDAPTLADAPTAGAVDSELFESITSAGKLLRLIAWRDAAMADAWQPPPSIRHRSVRVIRDYGMRDRREAPQFYPDV